MVLTTTIRIIITTNYMSELRRIKQIEMVLTTTMRMIIITINYMSELRKNQTN